MTIAPEKRRVEPCPEHGTFRWEHVNGEERAFCPVCKRDLAPPPTDLPRQARRDA